MGAEGQSIVRLYFLQDDHSLTCNSDEHLRRSPECFFFSTGAKSQAGGQARPKGKRASKASRVSNQSTLSVASEGMSIGELEPQESSVMSISSINTTSEPLGAKKKGTKTKKATKKAKGRTLQPMQDDSEVAGSYLEPEDDDFEVKIAATQKRGTKRTSDEIMTSAANDDGEGAEQDVEEHPNPPRKRRATKTRSTRANQAGEPAVVDDSLETTQLKDTQIAESMDMTIEEKVPVKKAQRGRKPKSSSTKRKTSTTSVASKASLRATVPNDEEIDAVLAEDLDRPLTDNGSDEDDSQITKPTKRPMAKTRAASNAGASAAPIRRATRTSSKTANDSITDGIRSHEEEPPLLQPEVSELESHELPMPKSRKGNTRKASAKEKPKASAKLSSALLETSQNGGADEAVSRTEPTKSRQASRQLVDKSGNALQDFDSNQAFGTDAMDDLTYPDVEQPVGELVQEQAINDQKTERPKRNQAKASPRVVRKEAETHLMDPSNEDVSEKASDEAKEQVGAEVEEDDLEKPVKKPGKGKKPAKAAKTGGKGSQGKKATSKELPEAEHVAAEPPPNDHAPSSPPPVASGKSTLDRGGQSPQSSDAENQPPSSRPTRSRPPLSAMSPVRQNEARVPLANITPSASPSKANISRLRSTLPWTAVDIDRVFQDTPGGVGDGDENGLLSVREVVTTKDLSSPEKKLTVEEWIKHNAVKAEERLRNDCERLVGRFENEGVRALKTLEGIVCVD